MRTILAIIVMLLGVAVLNTVDFKSIHLRRGEWETIIAAIFFSGLSSFYIYVKVR